MYTEETAIDLIQVQEDGQIQVRRVTRTLRDGVVLAKEYHRHVLDPGFHTIEDLKTQDPKVAKVAQALWSTEVIDARRAFLTAQNDAEQARQRALESVQV